jgi:intracellular sulfur oxidation DsrE/DsrF family protein
MRLPISSSLGVAAVLLGSVLAGPAQAGDSHPFATAHYVLQVSEDDPARWNLAMNNAQNLQNAYGPDKVEVVIVAYGPGLKMLLKKAKTAKRVQSLSMGGVEFDACHNTMKHMAKKLGHMPAMNSVAKVVPGGVVRIGELEQKGYSYIKP